MLVSGADFFDDAAAINAHMDETVAVDVDQAVRDHDAICQAFAKAHIELVKVEPPANCQDGVYTANWALVRDGKAVLSNLPNSRQPEQAYAEKYLRNLGLDIVKLPSSLKFSGQGDALFCGDYLFVGSRYRTDEETHQMLADIFQINVVGLATIPLTDQAGASVVNRFSGWPDSLFYDLDLALAVIDDDLIAWCPEAFTADSRDKINSLNINKIEVNYQEAAKGFACNLVSTGSTVIMSQHAPLLQAELEGRGYQVITPNVKELAKGGGFIRCVSLSI